MECREIQEKIMPFINEELPDDELEMFMNHVDSCKECNEELQISYSIFWGLQMLQNEHADSFHIQHALDAFMEKKREKIQKMHRIKKLCFYLFVSFIVIVILFFVLQLIRWMKPELFHELLSMKI